METTEKNQVLDKFIPLFTESELTRPEAAKRLGINICYINFLFMRNQEIARSKIGTTPIKAINDFLLSGKKLSEYQCPQKVSREVVAAAPAVRTEPEKKPIKKPGSNTAIQDRMVQGLIKAMEEAGMNNIEASRLLGVTPDSLAIVRNDKYRCKCPDNVWAAIKNDYNEDDQEIYDKQIPPWTESRGCWGCLVVVAAIVGVIIFFCLT